MTDYYDVNLKQARLLLENFSNFTNTVGMLEDHKLLYDDFMDLII